MSRATVVGRGLVGRLIGRCPRGPFSTTTSSSTTTSPAAPGYRRSPQDYAAIYNEAKSNRARFWMAAAQGIDWVHAPKQAVDERLDLPLGYEWFPGRLGLLGPPQHAPRRHHTNPSPSPLPRGTGGAGDPPHAPLRHHPNHPLHPHSPLPAQEAS